MNSEFIFIYTHSSLDIHRGWVLGTPLMPKSEDAQVLYIKMA
jgi:hypothetical protein